MEPVYRIPLIPQDLRQEENIIQIADVLDHLNNVITDVFRKIDERIEKNAARTKNVADRIAACSEMVDRLTGTNRATKIYCSAKYPAMDCHRDYRSVFSIEDDGVLLKRTHKDIKKTPAAYSEKELQDKLEFYHVKLSCPDPLQALVEGPLERGRGGVPPGLGALGALLVRGTAEPAYGGVGGSGVSGAAPQSPESPGARGLHAAPATVAQRERQAAQHVYLYSPDMGEVPSLDVPQDLPHLAGVAGDMRFLLEAEPTIAPSAQRGPVASAPSASVRHDGDQAIPPPVAAAPLLSPVTIAPQPSPEAPAPASPAPPPPPPPPPPLPDTEPDSTEEKKTAARETGLPTQHPVAPSLDSHASLMDAIRKAGGSGKARLRSTAAAAQTQPEGSKPGGTGDLMADLHARLSMRRKGISGAGAAGGTILAAISAIVPPPVVREPDTRSNSELSSAEDDWD